MFNRERFIRRCLDSVLTQAMTDYELIVVDDASTDGSVDVVKTYGDQVHLIQLSHNMGVLAARATGVDRAAGHWMLFLDSDDELVTNALTSIQRRVTGLPDDIMSALFRCRLDNGRISPDPMPSPAVFDYENYLRFLNATLHREHEFLHCVRASCLAQIPRPDSRLEDLYGFDFQKRFKSYVFADIARLYHQDSNGQLSKRALVDPISDPVFSRDRAVMLERLLNIHGAAMRQFAPALYHQYASQLATLQFLLGRRHFGMQYSMKALQARPWQARSWAIPILGMCGLIRVVRAMRVSILS